MDDTDDIFAAVLVASLLGLCMLALINLGGYLLLRRWHASGTEIERDFGIVL